MAISGGIKFFDKSRCLLKDGASITASSGVASEDYAIDQNVETFWRSSGSNDSTAETLTVVFDSREISRILILNHNFKNFNIKYDVSGVWTAFSSVVGINGSLSGITETTFADNSSYYEFTPVTTTQIQITINTTQVVNAEKYISQIIVTSEIGTLQGYPIVGSVDMGRNLRSVKTLSGFFSIQKSLEVPSFDLNFKEYPASSTYNVDFDVVMSLHDREDAFLVWLCGGRRGSTYFKYTLRGWRLQDVFQMQVSKPLKLSYSDNVYKAPISTKLELEAVI